MTLSLETKIEGNNNTRNYGIDFLRVLSMFMVIMLHILPIDIGEFLNIKEQSLYFFECACYCAVNCYALVSGYVGVRKKELKYSNLIYLWFEVVFYSLVSYLILFFISPTTFSWKNLIKVFIPVLGSKYWYFTSYFLLFFFMPILNHVVTTLSKKKLETFFFTIIPIICVLNIIKPVNVFGLLNGYSFLWLAILYMLGGYIFLYNPLKNVSSKSCFLYYFICVILLSLSRIALFYLNRRVNIFLDYTSILVLLCSIFLLIGFSKIKVKAGKFISVLSTLTFGVYILHTTDLFRMYIWNQLRYILHYNIFLVLLITLAFAILLYIACLVIDFIRLKIFKVLKVRELANCLEKGFKSIGSKLYNKFNKQEENVENETE